jgi:tetratricopeptide (TPR) repeat protein
MRPYALAALALLPAALAAQPAPGPMGGMGPGGPGRPMADTVLGPDRPFYLAQELRALDEKVSLLVETGKADAAIAEAKKAEAIDIPRNHPAYELKIHLLARPAQIYADTGRKKEALDALAKLGADVPKDSPAEAAYLLDAGRVYRKLKMTDEALKAFDRVIELSDKLAKSARPRHDAVMGRGDYAPDPHAVPPAAPRSVPPAAQ